MMDNLRTILNDSISPGQLRIRKICGAEIPSINIQYDLHLSNFQNKTKRISSILYTIRIGHKVMIVESNFSCDK